MAAASRGRRIAYAVAALAIALVLVELACRGYLALATEGSDPFTDRAGTRLSASLLAELEGDLATVEARRSLYVPDPELFWKLAPDRDLVVENSFWVIRGADPLTWDIRTDTLGCRSDEEPPGFEGLRVLTLGDSCTFGHRVPQAEIYPTLLAETLAEELGDGRPVHVRNAGVPGYTSHQGVLRMRRLLDERPFDLVTIAFGANDLERESMSDADRSERTRAISARAASWLGRTGFGRVLLSLTPGGAATDDSSAAPDAGVPRVSDASYRENVVAMIDAARGAGARTVLLDLVFLGPKYRAILRSIAEAEGVPLVDGRAVLDNAWRDIRSGGRYHPPAETWMRFYEAHVESYRPIYYGEEFYAERYSDPEARNRFILLMADPIHPNAVGHLAIADALAEAAGRAFDRR